MSAAAQAVLRDAALLGVQLRFRGDRIVARPSSALPTELANSIRQHRVDVLALLAMAAPTPKAPCFVCKSRRFFARPERLTWVCARCHAPLDPGAMVWFDLPESTP
jgi:hypothetical protein